jgi:hypothetical protein
VTKQSHQAASPAAKNSQERGTFWPTVLRLCQEAVEVLFVVGLHWGMKSAIRYTHQGEEWWAAILINGTALFAVIGVLVIGGFELLAFCWEAGRNALNRIKGT